MGTGNFNVILKGLNSGEEYLIRAYAKNDSGLAYSEFQYLFTENSPITELPLQEDFKGDSLPFSWKNMNQYNPEERWRFDNPYSREVKTSTSDNGFAILDSDFYGVGSKQDADLVSPKFDLSAIDTIIVSFQHYFVSTPNSMANFMYTTNNGMTWNTIKSWDQNTSNSEKFNADISKYVGGKKDVRLKWNYKGEYSNFWAIDDISLSTVYQVKFIVSDKISGEPIEGADVYFSDFQSKTTDKKGVAVFKGVKSKKDMDYLITASGYDNNSGSLDVKNSNIDKEIKLDPLETSIEKQQFGNIRIFPNPSHNILFYENDFKKPFVIELKDVNGRVLYSEYSEETQGSINVNDISSGIYFLMIYSYHSKGGKIELLKTKKIIIE
jgi:hypothetical protein